MPYPRRGAWLFTNVARGFDFTPRLDNILIKQEHPEALANLDADVVDEAAALFFGPEDEGEAYFDGERIWAGHFKGAMEDSLEGEQTRLWIISGQDFSAKLDDALIRRRVERKREKAKRRIRWLLSYMRPSIFTLAGYDLSGVPDAYVEAYEYYGDSVREGLQHVADELRLFFYVDFDKVLRMFRTETLAAPFDLDNVAPDYVTTFPFREWTHELESTELGNAFLVAPEKANRARWSKDSTSMAEFGRQERFVSEGSLKSAQAALNVGARALAQSKDPTEDSKAIVWEPGLRAGMRVHVFEGLWGHDFDRIISGVEIRASDPHDDAGQAMLVSELTLTDRRHAKRRGSGGGGTRATNKNTKPRPGQTADPDPYPLATFEYVVTPPALTPGASVGSIAYAGIVLYERSKAEVPVETGPLWRAAPNGLLDKVASTLWGYSGWTTRPTWTSCTALDNSFQGYQQKEMWYSITMPAHPANMGGIQLSVSAGDAGGVQGPGYGEVQGLEVVIKSSPPATLREGDVVGEVAANGSAVVVLPAGSIPAEGGVLYIGYRTKWEAPSKDEEEAYACGWTWPFMSNAWNVDYLGRPYCGYSGQIKANLPTAPVWLIAGAALVELGATATPANAPWVGGNTILDAGNEGAPTWSINGHELDVASEAPAGKGIYAVGDREDDDEPEGVWGDVAWGVDFDFIVDAHGDTAAAGTRSIELTTTGQGEQFVGRVQLGDQSYAEGVYVAGPTTLAYEPLALTLDERWSARFDTRAGIVRGKLWRLVDGEPAQWMVETSMGETEHDLDRWSLWVRVGNGVGFSQRVRIPRMRAYAAASSGQRVVKEWVGLAGGLDADFPTVHQYREGSLRAYVNGLSAGPSSQDGSGARYGLDFRPTIGSRLRVTYVKA